jgi:hypothetical protein
MRRNLAKMENTMKRSECSGFFITFVIAVFLLTAAGFAQYDKILPKQADEFARKSLASYLAKFVTAENFSRYGFKSFAEAEGAYLGEPYAIKRIGLQELKGYQAGRQAKALIQDANMLWYPVMAGNEVRSKLEILIRNGRLIPGEFGRRTAVEKIASAKRALPELLRSKNVDPAINKPILVIIPAMMITLFYIDSLQGEFLIPATVQPQRFDLQNNTIYKAGDLLAGLAAFAEKIDSARLN